MLQSWTLPYLPTVLYFQALFTIARYNQVLAASFPRVFANTTFSITSLTSTSWISDSSQITAANSPSSTSAQITESGAAGSLNAKSEWTYTETVAAGVTDVFEAYSESGGPSTAATFTEGTLTTTVYLYATQTESPLTRFTVAGPTTITTVYPYDAAPWQYSYEPGNLFHTAQKLSWTYTETVPAGITEIYDAVLDPSSTTEFTVVGPTTFTTVYPEDAAPPGFDNDDLSSGQLYGATLKYSWTYTEVLSSTMTEIFEAQHDSLSFTPETISGSIKTIGYLIEHVTDFTLTGPTTFVTVYPHSVWMEGSIFKPSWTYIESLPDPITEAFEALLESTTILFTLTGPTTFTTVHDVNAAQNGADQLRNPPPPTSATQCYRMATSIPPDHSVTYAELITVITEGQVVATTSFVEYRFKDGGVSYSPTTSVSTYTAGTTIYATFTTVLGPAYDTSNEQGPIGEHCAGNCGSCDLYFPSVSVYYWPVASANTACLGNATAATAQARALSKGIGLHPRALNGAGSTLVLDGFTFTSPSVYIAFPTISAADNCGLVGSVHTSVMLSFPPGEISTYVGNSIYSFNFADALCPPPSVLNVDHISIVGSAYRPIISPPPGLTSIDPEWVWQCQAAAFQGNDPPFALTPQANLSPFTTPTSAAQALPTSAKPSPQTSPPTPAPTSITTSSVIVSPLPIRTSGGDPQSLSNPTNDPAQETSKTPIQNVPAQTSSTQDTPPQNIPAQTTPSQHGLPSQSSRDPGALPILPTATPLDPLESYSKDSVSQTTSPNAAVGGPELYSSNGPPVISIAGLSFTANSKSAFVAGTATLVPGGPAITVSNVAISLDPSASFLVVGTITQALRPTANSQEPAAVITVNGQILTANSASNIIIGSQTLTPGGVITISGHPISLALTPLSTVSLSPLSSASTVPLTTPARFADFTFGGTTYVLNSASEFMIGTQTLIPGAPAITISGTPLSLAYPPSATAPYIVLDLTSTVPLALATSTPFTADPVFTFAGTTYMLNSASEFVIGTQTLVPGAPAITVDGTPVSLARGATDVVVGTSTEGLGGLIMSGFAGGVGVEPTATATATATTTVGVNGTINPFLGEAGRGVVSVGFVWLVIGAVVAGMVGR